MASGAAIRAGRAFVELFADDSKLTRGLRAASVKVKAFGKKIESIGMGMAKLGAAAAAPLAASTKVFAGFDDQMRAVQGVLGATTQDYDRLNAKAKLLGRTTSYTAAQVAGGMLELARAGFDATEIDTATKDMLSLARATGTDLAEATNIAGNSLRSFGLEADQMGRVADVLTATANNSAQTLTDLGEAMKYAAPVADDYGLSIEQTSKALGALANFGIKGSMAGNTLKNIMLQLSNPSVRKQIEALGVSVTDATGNFRDVGSILTNLGTAMQNIPTPQRLSLLNELFGKRAVAGGIKLTAANFEKLNDAIDNAAGTAQRTAKVMDSGLGGVFRRLWSAVEGVAIAVGETLSKELKLSGRKITDITNRMTEWISKNGDLIVSLAKTVAYVLAVGVALMALGKTVAIIGSVIGVIKVMVKVLYAVGIAARFAMGMMRGLGATVGIVAGITGAFVVATAAVIALGYAIEAAVQSQYELSDAARKTLTAGEQQRQKTIELSKELETLSKKSKLTNDEMKRAETIIKTLQGQYGNLGLSIDKITGKINGMANAQKILNEKMRQAADLQLQAAIQEENNNIQEIYDEMDSYVLKFTNQAKHMLDPFAEDKRIDKLNDKLKVSLLNLESLRTKLKALREGNQEALVPDDETGNVGAGSSAGVLGLESEADSLKRIKAETERWQRDLHRKKLEDIKDEHEREKALLKERYLYEIYQASKLGSLTQTEGLVTTINENYKEEKNQLDKKFRDKAVKAAEDARKEAQAAMDAKLQEQAQRRQAGIDIDDSNRADIEELILRTKYKGYELERKMLDLAEERAAREAVAAGANTEFVRQKWELEKKLLEANFAERMASAVTSKGTFNPAAIQGLQSGGIDAIRRATEATEKHTKEIAKNTKNQTGQVWEK